MLPFLSRLFGKRKTLKESHQEIEEIKRASSDQIAETTKSSVEASRQAAEDFDKISKEMESLAEDITIRIAKATRNLQQP